MSTGNWRDSIQIDGTSRNRKEEQEQDKEQKHDKEQEYDKEQEQYKEQEHDKEQEQNKEQDKLLELTIPNFRKLESQCISLVSFGTSSSDILDCPIWVLMVNVVAMEMLRTKIPPCKIALILVISTYIYIYILLSDLLDIFDLAQKFIPRQRSLPNPPMTE